MLNIDFKISGKLVSVPLCLSDTIQSLLTRMRHIKLFEKYSFQQLQIKLRKSLRKIIQSGNLQKRIIQKISILLSSLQKENNTKNCTIQKKNLLREANLSVFKQKQQSCLNQKFSFLTENNFSRYKQSKNQYVRKNPQMKVENSLQSKLRINYQNSNIKQSVKKDQSVLTSYDISFLANQIHRKDEVTLKNRKENILNYAQKNLKCQNIIDQNFKLRRYKTYQKNMQRYKDILNHQRKARDQYEYINRKNFNKSMDKLIKQKKYSYL